MKRMFILALLLLFGANANAVCNAGFTVSTLPNGQLQLTNTSTFSGYSSMTGAYYQIAWGDGLFWNDAYLTTANHSYTTTGTYTIVLTMWVHDSTLTNSLVCTSSYSQSVSVTGIPNTSCTFGINQSGAGLTKTFNAFNAGSLPNSAFHWNFGDGSTGSGNPVSHTYQYGGYYSVQATNTSCQGTIYTVDTVTGPVNCDSAYLSFSYANGDLQALHYTGAPLNGDSTAFFWDFGNGSSSTNGSGLQHPTYSPGTYTVTVTVRHYAAGSSTVSYCQKSYTHTVTVTAPGLASISGWILQDSSVTTPDTFRVWLVSHDAVANTLTAVDSTLVVGYATTYYSFPNVPAGDYLTKAAMLSGPASGPGFIPTYHLSSLYWSSATTISHGTLNSTGKNIGMLQGLVTSGPGFVGGSIALGANKGTGGGMAGVTVLIRNASLQAIQHSTSDGNGHYEFSNLPIGTYTIYPEITGYQTDPITVIITTSASSSPDNDFVVSQNGKTVKSSSLGLLGSSPRSAGLHLYPNPTKGAISLSWKAVGQQPVGIRVVNNLGVEVYRSTVENTGKAELQLGNLPRGSYWLRLTTGSAAEARQLVLE